jgi:putative tryptophan/tyrosine transport system substrate-binding protein
MRRRDFIKVVSGGAVAWPLAARTQQTGKVWRIGVLETISPALNAVNLDALRQGLREHGYVEGQNVVMEYRSAEGRGERFSQLVQELLGLKVDLILGRGTPAALAAMNATKTIPLVMVGLGDPLMLVPNLSRPGGNMTGLSSLNTDLQAKRLEVLHEAVPTMVRVEAVLNMGNPVIAAQWPEIEAAARRLSIEPRLFDVRTRDDLPRAIDAAHTFGASALMIATDALLQENAKLVVELAMAHRLPAMYAAREWVEIGGLISYGPSYPDLYRRSASYIDKIFKGANPGDLPIEQPTRFELIINLKTAKALDLDVPWFLRQRADEVIE